MTARPTKWVDFSQDDWQRLIDLRNLFCCLKITTDPDEDKWSDNPSFGFPPKLHEGFTCAEPNISTDSMIYSTYNKTVHSYHYSGYDVAEANLAVPGIASGSMTAKSSESSTSTDMTEELYVTTVYKVPKLRLSIKPEKIQLSDEFIHAIVDAISSARDKNFADLNLQQVLNKYGHYVVTELQLGGLLRGSASKIVTSHSDAQEFSESVKASFEANLAEFDVPLSGGASYEHGETHGESHQQDHKEVKVEVTGIGGDPAKIGKYSDWAATLQSDDDWHIIRVGGLMPVINFLPQDLLVHCASIINQVEGYSDYLQVGIQKGTSVLDG